MTRYTFFSSFFLFCMQYFSLPVCIKMPFPLVCTHRKSSILLLKNLEIDLSKENIDWFFSWVYQFQFQSFSSLIILWRFSFNVIFQKLLEFTNSLYIKYFEFFGVHFFNIHITFWTLLSLWRPLFTRVGLRLTNRYQIKYIGYLCINIQFKVGLIKIQHSKVCFFQV